MEAIQYTIIDRPDRLPDAWACLRGRRCLALDLEMENQRFHYGLHIALVQISTADHRHFIFDPLAGLDLGPLRTIFSDPQIELIVHDADFDRHACRQVLGVNLTNVFDTKIAAQLCGYRKFGLASLLQDLLSVETNKKYQKSDWLKRPLAREALDYAARDTASLHVLKDILARRLESLGRLDWAREEFLRDEREPAAREDDTPPHLRIKHAQRLSPRQLSVLAALAEARDAIARTLNRPVHFVIRNDLMLGLAANPPVTVQALRKIQGLHPAIYRESGAQRLLDAVRRGQAAPIEPAARPKPQPRSQAGYENRLKAMQAWRALAAAPYGLEPYLMLPTDVLNWAARHPGQPMPPDVAGQIRDWQKPLLWAAFLRQFPGVPAAARPA